MFTMISQFVRSTTGRMVLGAALAGCGTISTAQAHHDEGLDVNIDLHGRTEIGRRHWVGEVYENRETRVWVEPVYQTAPRERVWIEPVYRTVVDHVFREAVTREDRVQVLVPETFELREVYRDHHRHHQRICIPAHYETRCQTVVVCPAHYEDVSRQELACEGHWQTNDQQVLVTPGHFEVRVDRICVTPGHFDERTVLRIGR